MEWQLYGLTLDFLGTVLLLLFLDPLKAEEEIHNTGEISKEKIIKRYLMKRYFALFVIILGFIIQMIALVQQ